MNQVISKTAHEWSSDQLFAKAQNYILIMHEKSHDDWQFGLWSSLSLEFLIRATLAHKSITLIADLKDYNNLMYALGINVNQSKFTPKSANITDILNRINQIFPNFTDEMKRFCLMHINRRNSELHTGNSEFQGLSISSWLPKFYWVCKELCVCMEKELKDLLSIENVIEAESLINELNDKSAEQIKGLISAHKTMWDNKTEEDKKNLTQQSIVLMTRHTGHRVICPSCKNTALVIGEAIGEPIKIFKDNDIVEKINKKPSQFECIACGLKISGYSKLLHCNLGDTYTTTSTYTPEEYFDFEPEQYSEMGYFDDNNEF
ncbi:hypothetical protein ACJ7Z2_01320 [Mannheimia glucosida]|uniref:hypothetical protein n=1 Tax=Mannheimia glucosida TaxID=85401 RepID=UPI003917D846